MNNTINKLINGDFEVIVAQKCDTCYYNCAENASPYPDVGMPYPEFWCSKDHWEGLGYEPMLIDYWAGCQDYEPEPKKEETDYSKMIKRWMEK
jgi:hypothetical protein